ncbi:MAG: GxGYxYP domain-containing protein, partial [Planctomycetota bacterium]
MTNVSLIALTAALVAALGGVTAPVTAEPETPASGPQPGHEVMMVDLRRAPFDKQLAFTTLQGQVNQGRPKLFVVLNDANPKWVDSLEAYGHFELVETSPSKAMRELLPQVGRQVIADQDRPWTISLATTIAGLENAVVSLEDLGVETVFDTRGRWETKAEGYAWAMEHLMPRVNLDALAFLDTGLPNLRDWIVSDRLMTIDLDPINDEAEIALLDRILEKYPAMTPVLGWPSDKYADEAKGQNNVTVEHALVDRLSRRDMLLVPADYADNISVLRELPTPEQLHQHIADEVVFDPEKRYITLILSDGDNMQYDLNRMRDLWVDPGMHQFPLGWTTSPQWADVAPAVMEIYYRESAARGGKQEFVTGPSGFAYAHPGSLTPNTLDQFVAETHRTSAALDLKSMVVLDHPRAPWQRTQRFLGVFAGEAIDAAWLAEYTDRRGIIKRSGGAEMAFLSESTRLDGSRATPAAVEVNRRAPDERFQMVYVDAWTITGEVLADFERQLDDNIDIVA